MAALWVAVLVFAALGLHLLAPSSGLVRRYIVPFFLVLAFLAGLGFGYQRWRPGRASDLVFIVVAIVSIVSAFRVVTHEKVLFSAFYLILLVISTAVLVLLLGAQFLAAALVLVYAGAIIVVYVFVIMLAQEPGRPRYERNKNRVVLGVISAAVFAGSMVVLQPGAPLRSAGWDQSNVAHIGKTVLIDYVITLELAGVLLLSAVIGAVALAKARHVTGRSDNES